MFDQNLVASAREARQALRELGRAPKQCVTKISRNGLRADQTKDLVDVATRLKIQPLPPLDPLVSRCCPYVGRPPLNRVDRYRVGYQPFQLCQTPHEHGRPDTFSIQRPEDNFPKACHDAHGAALLIGAREEDGGGSGQPLKTTADGSCLFNAAALGGWGRGHRQTKKTDVLALPLRFLSIRHGVLAMEKHVGNGANSWLRQAAAFDTVVSDKAKEVGVDLQCLPTPGPCILTEDSARAMLVIALEGISHSACWGSVFCLPLMAEVVEASIRCFNPGEVSSHCDRNAAALAKLELCYYIPKVPRRTRMKLYLSARANGRPRREKTKSPAASSHSFRHHGLFELLPPFPPIFVADYWGIIHVFVVGKNEYQRTPNRAVNNLTRICSSKMCVGFRSPKLVALHTFSALTQLGALSRLPERSHSWLTTFTRRSSPPWRTPKGKAQNIPSACRHPSHPTTHQLSRTSRSSGARCVFDGDGSLSLPRTTSWQFPHARRRQ